MNTKKQTLIKILSSTISPDLVCGWKSSIGNSVRGEIVGLHRNRPTDVYVIISDGLFSAHVDGGWRALDCSTPQEAVCLAIREWAKYQTFDHLPKSVRALPGVAEDAKEKKRGDIRVRIFETKAGLDFMNRERDNLTVRIDQQAKHLEQLEQTLKTMEME
jgi:hypothetical protein